jgi:hypothetical protein
VQQPFRRQTEALNRTQRANHADNQYDGKEETEELELEWVQAVYWRRNHADY